MSKQDFLSNLFLGVFSLILVGNAPADFSADLRPEPPPGVLRSGIADDPTGDLFGEASDAEEEKLLYLELTDMRTLLKEQESLDDLISRYLNDYPSAPELIDLLRRLTRRYFVRLHADFTEATDLTNAGNMFALSNRLTSGWEVIQTLLETTGMSDELLGAVERLRHVRELPTKFAIEEAAFSLFRSQDIYQLSARALSRGIITGIKGLASFTADDCYQLGRIAFSRSDYYHALMWLHVAWENIEAEEPLPTANLDDVFAYLAPALHDQGNPIWAENIALRLHKLNPEYNISAISFMPAIMHNALLDREAHEGTDPRRMPTFKLRRPKRDGIPRRSEYEALCREHLWPKANATIVSSQLNCFYKNDRPFLKIAPLKAEMVNEMPIILVFRQILSDREVEELISLIDPRLQQAGVGLTAADRLAAEKTLHHRNARNAWIADNESEVAATLSRRVEDMTGLYMKHPTAEFLQVANYGLGGHYHPHYDFAREQDQGAFKTLSTGNRIATVLIYLVEPVAGGATVFPKLGIGVQPTAKDAVFWHNLLSNGERDKRTLHAACPVLLGNKWVGNKWIHERGQEFRRPCALHEHDIY